MRGRPQCAAPRSTMALAPWTSAVPSRGARVAPRATPEPGRGNRKKQNTGGRRAKKPQRQEFVEDEGRREREFADVARRVRAREAPVEDERARAFVGANAGEFEAKLAELKAKKRDASETFDEGVGGASFDMNAKVDFGGAKATPRGPMANRLADERAPVAKEDEEDGNQTLVRVVSFLAACALVVVFIPSDLTFNAPAGTQKGGLSDSVKEEVRKQAEAVEEALTAAPEDADKLRQAAQSWLALDDYPKALPFLERLVAIDPSNEENVSALAETWIADGQPSRAVEAYRGIIDAEVLGKGPSSAPSSSFLRGYLDALGKAGRNGLALEYAKTFSKKGWVDDVDSQLLQARVYSAWKGHGKEADQAFQEVVDAHPDDFRAHLAQGVFYRQVGKPDAAENSFRKAKSLAPADVQRVIKEVIAASKSQT